MLKGELIDRTGEKSINNQGYEVEIIKYLGVNKCTVKFNDEFLTVLKNIRLSHFRSGSIKNPNHRSIYGVGYLGIGKYKSVFKGKPTRQYYTWRNMLERCYNEKTQQEHLSYKNVTVCEDWHNFQNFAKWYEENFKFHMQDWHLDKDILIKGNKIYSPEKCCFVPQSINSLLIKANSIRGNYPIGVHKLGNRFIATMNLNYIGTFDTPEEAFEAYKIVKENHIKRIAEEWKYKLDIRVFKSLYSWKVEIKD